jgi:putative toxin-antitoxin system antitoxin component (TIGR02293 family)
MEVGLSRSHQGRVDEAIGFHARSRRDLIDATRRGLPTADVDEVLQSGRLSLAEIDRIVLPRKTLSHRRKIGHLTPEQSDRFVRVVRAIAAAENTFGSPEKASRWLRRPTRALDGDTPLGLLDTSEGTREVEELLHRIDHGLAA